MSTGDFDQASPQAQIAACIDLLEETQTVLQKKRRDIHTIICELATVEGEAARLIIHIKQMASQLKEVNELQ